MKMKTDRSQLNLNLVLNTKRLKETEKALQYELAKNRAMIENSRDCIKILDTRGSILYMNRGGLEEHGFKSTRQAIGWDWVASLEKPYRKKALANLKQCLRGISTTVDVQHVPGSKRGWCSITLTPIKNGRGRIIQLLAVSRDITGRKLVERKLKDKIRLLGQRLKMGNRS